MMEILRRLNAALTFPLFQISGHQVTLLRFLIAGVILMVAWWLGRWFARLCHTRLLSYVETGPRYTIVRLLQYGIWVIALLAGLYVLGIRLTALAVVAGVLGVGIGFGLQNLVANFVAGLVLLLERPIRVRDFVTTEEIEGKVQEISFRSTNILTNDNIAIIVPNSQFINSTVINWSHGDPRVRIRVPVGVAYGSDVDLVTRSLLRCAEETEGVLSRPEPTVCFTEFGDSSLNFELRVWTDQPIDHEILRSRLNYAIDAAFRSDGIEIPFPQRDLHIRSGAPAIEAHPGPPAQDP